MLKLGIVFSGGGAKGAFQIGFCKALYEFVRVENITAVSAASIGAWNAVALLTQRIPEAEEIWRGTNVKGVRNTVNLFTKRTHITTKMERLLENSEIINKDFYVACCELPAMKTAYLNLKNAPREDLRQVLEACVSIPCLMEPVRFKQKSYVDGAFRDNIPLKPLRSRKDLDLIIVVHFDPLVPAIIHEINRDDILEIYLSPQEQMFIKDSFDFRHVSISQMMRKGYEDSLNVLEEVFRKGTEDLEAIKHTVAHLHQERRQAGINVCSVVTCLNKVSDRVERVMRRMSKQAERISS